MSRAGRRPDAQSVDLRAARGDPRRAGRGGRRPAELAERRHGRRARGGAVGEGRARGAVRSQQAGLRRGARPGPRPKRRAERRRDRRARWSGCAPARSPRRPATDSDGRFAVGDAVGFVDDEIVAWGEPEATLRAVLDALADGAELFTCIAGDGAPLDEAGVSRAGVRAASSWSARAAASRAGGGCSRPSDRPARRADAAARAASPRARLRRPPSLTLDAAAAPRRPLRWPRPSALCAPLTVTPQKAAEAAATLGLVTVGDLLEHLPRDRREARTVATLTPDEVATVVVEVRSITSRPVRRGRDEAARRGARSPTRRA